MSQAGAGHGAVEVDVAIVGAGFAGLGAAIQLARRVRQGRGTESFLVLERAGEVGGTWRENTYPGVACDVPSQLYSYSFAPKPDWSRVFAPGGEIQDYLRACAREVAPNLRLGCEVLAARWVDGAWRLDTSTGPVTARVLVLAAGRLTEPRTPDVEGLQEFAGPVFHTARWDHGADLTGRVGVVGTGASAVQVVPRLAEVAARVTVFQRSAAWIVPRGDRETTPAEREAFTRDPGRQRALREATFTEMERGLAARRRQPEALEGLRDRALDHLAAQVGDPDLRAALTPDYEIGCKRVLLSDEFYPALASQRVHLVPAAVRSVTPSAGGDRVRAADGSEHVLDALVLATGFHATRQPYAERVVGREGTTLARAWAGGMVSHASTVVHGFPNLFVLDGPNASLGHNSAVHVIESQLGYLLGALDHLRVRPVLEVGAAAQRAYTAEIDAMAADSVWLQGECSSWYVDERSGRLTLLWPDTATEFRRRNGRFDPAPFL